MKHLKTTLALLAGNLLITFSVAAFLAPTGIVSGGSAGIGLFFLKNFQVPISLTQAILNVVCFFLGLAVLGRRFALTTVVSSVLTPILLRFFEGIPALGELTDDLLLCALLSGVLMGAGMGVVMRVGSSTGGLDIPPLVANKLWGISVGTVMMGLNAVILTLQFFFSDPEQILYGLVQVGLTSLAVDKVVLSGKKQAQVLIVSPKYEEIRDAILTSDLGLSMVSIETGYTRVDQKAVLCAIPPRKLPKVENLACGIDPTCFLLVSSVTEIRGRGFTMPR